MPSNQQSPLQEQSFHVSGWMGCLWFIIIIALAGAAGGLVVAVAVR